MGRFKRLANSILVSIACTAICASVVFAKNTVVLMGGGCETADNNTFRVDFANSIAKYKSLGWNVEILYADGENIGDTKTKPFTKESVKSLTQKLSTDSSDGDQVLFEIITHCSSGPNHGYCYGTRNAGTKQIEATEFADMVKPLHKNQKTNIAVIDRSCFGGGTFKSFDLDEVCVVASAPPTTRSLSSNSFDSKLIGNMKKGRSLERVYLQSLNFEMDPPNPYISSNLSKKIDSLNNYANALHKYYAPIVSGSGSPLEFDLVPIDIIDLNQLVKNDSNPSCPISSDFAQTLKDTLKEGDAILNELRNEKSQQVQRVLLDTPSNLSSIVEELENESTELAKLNKKRIICPSEKFPEECSDLKRQGWDNISPEAYVLLKSPITKTEKTSKRFELWVKILGQMPEERKYFEDFATRRKTLAKDISSLSGQIKHRSSLTTAVWEKHYNEPIYRAVKDKDQKALNRIRPCRQFVF